MSRQSTLEHQSPGPRMSSSSRLGARSVRVFAATGGVAGTGGGSVEPPVVRLDVCLTGNLVENPDSEREQLGGSLGIIPTRVAVLASMKEVVPQGLEQPDHASKFTLAIAEVDVLPFGTRGRADDLAPGRCVDESQRLFRSVVAVMPTGDEAVPTRRRSRARIPVLQVTVLL